MNYKELPSQERLKELFTYNPQTGDFIRNIRVAQQKPGTVAGSPGNGYIYINVDGSKYRAHRLAWMYMNGEDPQELIVDHINRDKTDNSYSNLRLATKKENNINRGKKTKGYYYDKRYNQFYARIKVDGRAKFLGYYKTEAEATEAYERAAKALYGDFYQ